MWNFIFYAAAAKKQKDPPTYFPPLSFPFDTNRAVSSLLGIPQEGEGEEPNFSNSPPYSSSSSAYAKEDVIISFSIFCVSAFYVNTEEEEEEEEEEAARGVSAQAPPTKFESRYTEKIPIPSHAALTKNLFLLLSYFRILPNNPTVAEQLSPPQNKDDDYRPRIDSHKKEGK